METVLQDVRFALRLLRRAPGFTLAAVSALALGIGANTAIFSVINTVLLRPLPYPDPDRLVIFLTTLSQGEFPIASPTKFNTWRRQSEFIGDVAAYRFHVLNLTTDDEPEQIAAGQVSGDFFRLLGAPFVAGRAFSADEDRPNASPVVILSETIWRRRFNADPAIVGRTLPFNGKPHLVVGVLGAFDTEALRSAARAPDVWTPLQIDPNSAAQGNYLSVIGRLRPAASLEAANAQLQQAASEFRQAYPTALGRDGGFAAQPLHSLVVRNVRTSLWLLVGAVTFVLLIACANVANLLLVRASVRRREIAIRLSVGGSRARIARQLLSESLILSLIGGALGLVVGVIGIRALLALNPGNIPRIGEAGAAVALDSRVLTFTILASLITGLLFGILPAYTAPRLDLAGTLKEDAGCSTTGARQSTVRALLVVSEMALALVLLVGAALLIRTLVAIRAVDPGFDARGVLTMNMSLAGSRFTRAADIGELMRQGTEQLQAIPGVESAAASCCVPLQGGINMAFVIEGRPLEGPYHGGGAFVPASPGYFETFRIPLRRGRGFTEQDTTGAQGVVIINEALARRYWPDGAALGAQITIGRGMGPNLDEPPRQIVGIVGDVRDLALNRDPQPAMYVPWAQLLDLRSNNLLQLAPLSWMVRTQGSPLPLSASIQRALRDVSGGLPVAGIEAMDVIVDESTARSDFYTSVLTAFAASALLLAAIGIYGLMAYAVQQRRSEIGIRLAVGADVGDVWRMVVGQGLRVAFVGIVMGLAAAFGLTRLMASLLFGVTAYDPLVFIIAPFVLSLVAFVGVWLPARRAAAVDPVAALRAQ